MNPSLKGLLDEILSLYYRVSLASLRLRLDCYHKCLGHTAKSHALKVKVSLMEYVSRVSDKSSEFSSISHDLTESSESLHKKRSVIFDQPVGDDQSSYSVTSPLAEYFKSHRGTQSSLQLQLHNSIWEHVNLAFQCVLRCDDQNARLHVEIVHSALGQLEAFVSEEEYCELCSLIISRIDELKAVSNGVVVPQ